MFRVIKNENKFTGISRSRAPYEYTVAISSVHLYSNSKNKELHEKVPEYYCCSDAVIWGDNCFLYDVRAHASELMALPLEEWAVWPRLLRGFSGKMEGTFTILYWTLRTISNGSDPGTVSIFYKFLDKDGVLSPMKSQIGMDGNFAEILKTCHIAITSRDLEYKKSVVEKMFPKHEFTCSFLSCEKMIDNLTPALNFSCPGAINLYFGLPPYPYDWSDDFDPIYFNGTAEARLDCIRSIFDYYTSRPGFARLFSALPMSIETYLTKDISMPISLFNLSFTKSTIHCGLPPLRHRFGGTTHDKIEEDFMVTVKDNQDKFAIYDFGDYFGAKLGSGDGLDIHQLRLNWNAVTEMFEKYHMILAMLNGCVVAKAPIDSLTVKEIIRPKILLVGSNGSWFAIDEGGNYAGNGPNYGRNMICRAFRNSMMGMQSTGQDYGIKMRITRENFLALQIIVAGLDENIARTYQSVGSVDDPNYDEGDLRTLLMQHPRIIEYYLGEGSRLTPQLQNISRKEYHIF